MSVAINDMSAVCREKVLSKAQSIMNGPIPTPIYHQFAKLPTIGEHFDQIQ